MSNAVYKEDINDPNEIAQEMKFKEMEEELGGGDEMNDYIAKFLGASDDAKESETRDKAMGLMEGLRTYPKAAFWSILLSSVLVMEGYDTALLGSFFGFTPFAKRYGELTPAGIYEIPARWQTGLSMCTNIGEIIGLQLAGIAADRYGYRKTLMVSLSSVIAFIFILFFAQNKATLAVGEILCGIPWGVFQTLTVSYATEVCPLVLRFYLTTYVNVCWVFGQLIASGVLKGLNNNTTEWAYRIPFAVQWAFPIPIIIGIYFAPEGPYWLIRKNRYAEARESLIRLMTKTENTPDPAIIADIMITKMKITVENENTLHEGSSYASCFKGVDARRTRITIISWLLQAWCGSTFMGYSTYFYEKAGLDSSNAFTFNIIQNCLGLIGTLLSWTASNKFGRFDIFFSGLLVQTILLFVIGGLGCANSTGASWGIGSLLLVYVFVYDSSVGPVTYCLVGEMPSSRLRTKSIVLARNVYNLAGVVNAIWTPYMLNTTQWNWGAKVGFFWGGLSLIFLVWMWFDLPETKGRTYAELDLLFEKKIKARDFKNTEVDPFEAAALVHKLDKAQIEKILKNEENEQ